MISRYIIATSVVAAISWCPALEWVYIQEGVAYITDLRLTKFEFAMPSEDLELALLRAEILDNADGVL